jgi:Na+-transporting NADH:ubiquinone oxidoreductase subunit NqrE
MIQRIQSIFLLLGGASFLGLFGAPFASSTTPIPNLLADMTYNVQDHIVLMVLAGLGGLISLAAIFLFNNRALQKRMTYVATTVSILILVVAALLMYNERTLTDHADKIHDQIGLYLPMISLIMSVLATRYIGKDEETVRSMDRLR